MKLIFVTGGVISGLGKGITAASIGRIMKSAGYKVTMAKMDPYLQIDAGTMSPYEHGETFVTTDGFETDLDLGHYERFIDEELTKYSSVTTGQIYRSVMNKERRGDYLGKTVQVIPHVTDEIKDRIRKLSEGSDVAIIEIGGTVGDIEGPHFIESMRQLRHDLGKENVLFVHVAPIVTVTTSGEMKTKAIQHSIIKLREVGIHANVLVCRTQKPLEEGIKGKLAMFCDIGEDRIIEAVDQNIYQVPLSFQKQGLDKYIINRFFHEDKRSDMSERENLVNKLMNPEREITVGISGKYTNLDDSYISVLEALKHAGANYNTKVNIEWIETTEYQGEDRENKLKNFISDKNISAIVSPGGFGDRGIEGMINVANYCRANDLPYLGLCLGLQVATIGFARNVCGLDHANSGEFAPQGDQNVIDIMETQKGITNKGGTMRLGSYDAILKPDTRIRNLYKEFNQIDLDKNLVKERHRHRFEVNPDYHRQLEEKGFVISGTSPDGTLVEFIEIPDHKYYAATQAHPELKSRINKPHPLFLGLIKSVIS
ncbi:MAG TPA: CTP synthase (glutamine hydrolyzing) [Candidatus Absconditabacterales bacterium]|nr:CTP synthase (glutamine hydrolyzing) [Candidatus Absconditabacterales bacterium]